MIQENSTPNRVNVYYKNYIETIYISESEMTHLQNNMDKFGLDEDPICILEFVIGYHLSNLRTEKSLEQAKEKITQLLVDYHTPLPF